MNSFFGFFVGIFQAISSLFGLGHQAPAVVVDTNVQTQVAVQQQSQSPQDVVNQYGAPLPQAITQATQPLKANQTSAPVPAISAKFIALPQSGPPPLSLYFNTLGTTGYIAYYIDFGDGEKLNMYQSATDCMANHWCVAHTYRAAGLYTATLYGGATLNDKAGETLQGTPVKLGTIAVTVTAQPSVTTPTAIFWAKPASGAAPLHPYFYTPGTSDYASYYVDFGDGTKMNMYFEYRNAKVSAR